MRIAPIFLITSLCFHILEIPPLSLYARTHNPKTCCGRPVCLCVHPKGAPCPLKNSLGKKIDPGHQNHRFCHLRQRGSSAILFETKEAGIPQEPVTSVFFKRAPCDSDVPKSNVPNYSKDFDLNFSFEGRPSFEPEFSLHLADGIPILLFDHRLDRPPKDPTFLSF